MIPRDNLPGFAAAVGEAQRDPWIPYPHLEFIAKKVTEAIRKPGGGRLIINISPRHGKSRLISHYLPTWYLEAAPERHVMVGSYGARLAEEWGRKTRDTFEQVGELHTSVRPDVRATNRWATPEGGGMVSAGVGGPILGKGYHLGIIDDPHKSWDEAQSSIKRKTVHEWFDGTFRSRAEPNATIILIQQRLHEDDLAGYLLSQYPDEWDAVVLPAIAEDHDPMGRAVGEALCPGRYPVEALKRMRGSMPPALWDAMHGQHPRPPGGTIIHEAWLKFYDQAPSDLDKIILSWDMAFKDSKSSSYVVGQVWGRKGANAYLLDQVRDRMDFVRTIDAFKAQIAKWPQARRKLVEDKANGPAILSSLQAEIPGLIPITPQGSKESRCYAHSTLFEAGNIWIPNYQQAPWVRDYVAELVAFPGSQHDDQVDSTTQALQDLYPQKRISTPGEYKTVLAGRYSGMGRGF